MSFQCLLILRESGEFILVAPTYVFSILCIYKYRFIDFQKYCLRADSMWLKQIPGEYVLMLVTVQASVCIVLYVGTCESVVCSHYKKYYASNVQMQVLLWLLRHCKSICFSAHLYPPYLINRTNDNNYNKDSIKRWCIVNKVPRQ